MIRCMDLRISDTWVASEVHTPEDAHAHARSSSSGPHTRARMQRWSVSTAEVHMRSEIFTSLRSHITAFNRILTDSRSLHACIAPPYTHTRARAHVHTHSRACTMEASIRMHVYIQRGKGRCVCALDIDNLRCRGSSMALEQMCVSVGIRIATCLRARARKRRHRRRRHAERPRIRRRPTERSPPRCAPGRKRRILRANT
jgi:hypothetical protein